jgi:membrane associated rhomboid family serine protease
MIPLADDNPSHSVPWVTYLVLGLNILVFLYQLSLGPAAETFIRSCAFLPIEFVTGEDVGVPTCVQPVHLTIFTAMFMHAGLLHIGSNMLYLWIFGNNVEDSMGALRFLVFYLICGVIAALIQTFFVIQFAPQQADIPNVGASGAVAGVLGGYLLLYPHARVRTLIALGFFWTMTRVPALIVLGLWFVLQFLRGIAELGATGATEATGGIAFWAHIGGFVAGLLLVKLFARGERGRRAMPMYRF